MNRRSRPGADVQYRTVPLQQLNVRAEEGEEGTFEGVACRYGVRDSYGTTFRPGVFRKGGLDAGTYALLDMHNPGKPIGTFTAREKGDHLAISGQYDDTQAGRDARARARSGSAPELSVGFVRTDMPATWEEYDALSDKQKADLEANIRSARLVEVSQITARMAAVPGSALTGVRTAAGIRAGSDADEDPSALIAALDATLDEAVALAGEYPREGLPEEVAQALDLLVGAEALVDQVMDALGIFDPDDTDDQGGAEGPPAAGAASADLALERARARLLLAGSV